MMHGLTNFAAGDLLGSLGIDVQMLIFQILGFGVLVWVMAKFVYPPLIKVIDERQAKIDEGNKAAKNAEENAKVAQEKIDKMLRDARTEAKDIVTTAKDEAIALAEESQERSRAEAERMVNSAKESISKEIISAKKALQNETISLVALATEKVISKTVTEKVDNKVIEAVLNER